MPRQPTQKTDANQVSSSSSSTSSGGKPATEKKWCHICQEDAAHPKTECPKRHCQRCGKRGHNAWESECPKRTENAATATAKNAATATTTATVEGSSNDEDSNDSSVCSIAYGEAYTTIDTSTEDDTSEYALSVGQWDKSQEGRGEP